MADLFDTGDTPRAETAPRPLADRLRPRRLADVIGQEQVLGHEAPLGVMLDSGSLGSLILWGPPGVGKTTIARLLADETDLHFVQISAIFTGVPELRKVFEEAKHRRAQGRGTLLFVDEIHRFNKAQQDGFLPHMEDGTILLVGATTENPSFELNAALLSRAQVMVLTRLALADLERLTQRAEQELGRALPLDGPAREALLAIEDIGLADPQAQSICLHAWETYERRGSPEGELALGQAVAYLALAPKSNAGYVAYKAALREAKKTGSEPPPKHILNAPTRLMKEQGYGDGYAYDHDAEDGFSGQNYFPDGMKRPVLYQPVERGYERELKKRLEYFAKLRLRRT